MYNAAAMNDAVLGTWGENATIWVGNVATVITGIFSEPRAAASVGGLPMDRNDPVFAVRTADWLASGAPPSNARLDVGTRRFTIVKPLPDDGGMTELKLRNYS